MSIDTSKAMKLNGVKAFLSHKDIPGLLSPFNSEFWQGSNLWGDVIADEELFASETVLHYGI